MATRNAINVLIKLLGGQEMVAELEKLGTSGEKAFKEIEGAANKVNLAKLGGALNTFGTDLATVARRASLAVTGIVAGATAAAPAILLIAKAGADAADQVGKAAQATGLQTEAYQKLAFAAEQAGTGQQQFVTAMSKFNREIVQTADKVAKGGKTIAGSLDQTGRDIREGVGFTVEAFKELGVEVTRFGDKVAGAGDKTKKGTRETATAFEQLGIKVRDASGRLKSTETLLGEVADAFQKMPDGARKSALAVAMFGEAGAKLIPFLNDGAAGIAEVGRQLGIIFTRDQINAAEAYNDALGALSRAASGVRAQVGLIFVPALTQAANAFRNVILQNRAAILSFANGAVKTATVLVKDLILAMTGHDTDVENIWILEWRDAIIGFGDDFKQVVGGVVLPALGLLRDAATLTTDAINGIFGTDITAGELLISATIVKLIGGFALLRSSISLAVQAIAFFSRAMVANPWIAAAALVAGGIAAWATEADGATAAMERHRGFVDDVSGAYEKAGKKVAEMGQKVRDNLLIEARNAVGPLDNSITEAVENLKNDLAQFDGLVSKAADPIFELFRQFVDGTKTLDEFSAGVARLGAENPELGILAKQIADLVAPIDELTKARQVKTDWIDLLTGKITDAEFQARQMGETLNNLKPPADVAKPVDDIGAAADTANAKVEALGKTITVTRFGEQGMSKEVFDLVDGVARRVDQSKAKLDELGLSATQAGAAIQGVSEEITNSVQAVPQAIQPGAATAAVDGVIADIGRIAPAAQQAAGEVSAALSDVGTIDASGAEQAAAAIIAPFQSLTSQIEQIFAGLRTLVQSGFSNLASIVSQLASQIEAAIARILAGLQRAAAAAARLKAQASSSSGSSSRVSPANGFAGGGSVHGPGTSTSDSILARLSNGEFVMQAKAVRNLGVGFLNALNNGFVPSLKNLRGFSVGGVVDGLNRSMSQLSIPRYANGGLALSAPVGSGSGRPFVLQLPDGRQIQGMTATEDAISQLQRFALSESMFSAGRKPRRS